jgi:hypothetical protein
VSGDHEHRHVGLHQSRSNRFQDIEAAHAGHGEIENNQIEGLAGDGRDGLLAIVCDMDLEAGLAERRARKVPVEGIVVDEKYLAANGFVGADAHVSPWRPKMHRTLR